MASLSELKQVMGEYFPSYIRTLLVNLEYAPRHITLGPTPVLEPIKGLTESEYRDACCVLRYPMSWIVHEHNAMVERIRVYDEAVEVSKTLAPNFRRGDKVEYTWDGIKRYGILMGEGHNHNFDMKDVEIVNGQPSWDKVKQTHTSDLYQYLKKL